MLILWRNFMSPQTETKTSSGFKAGVKDYRLFWFAMLLKFFLFFTYFVSLLVMLSLEYFSKLIFANI